jgi:hypothetical protein
MQDMLNDLDKDLESLNIPKKVEKTKKIEETKTE